MKNVFKKAWLVAIATAFALVVSTSAHAAGTAVIEKDSAPLTAGGWVNDRHAPSSWNDSEGSATVTIGETMADSGTFYRTEGKKKELNNATVVEAELFLDPAWANIPARAGLWATSNNEEAEWGVIDYTTTQNYTAGGPLAQSVTFRTWDSNADIGWTPVPTTYELGSTVNLRIELSNNEWSYYINDIFIRSVPLATPATGIKEVILDHYNYSAEAEVNLTPGFAPTPYTVHWTGLKANGVESYDTIQEALDAAAPGATINLSGQFSEDITVARPVTINADSATLTGSVLITGSNVTINGLTITNSTGHGIQAYAATGVVLNDVTITESAKDALLVNGSVVTTNNLTTSGNAWGGINVDQGVGVTTDATLILTGTTSQTESGPDIWKDDNAKTGVTIQGLNDNYAAVTYTHDEAVQGTKYFYNVVKTEAELQAALLDENLATIKLGGNITSVTPVIINRAVTIDGNNKTLTLNAPGLGNTSSTGFGVYKTANVKNLTVTTTASLDDNLVEIANADTLVTFQNVTVKDSAKAGIIVLDGAKLALTGTAALTGNAWGGIEVKSTPGTNVSFDGVTALTYVPKENTNTPVAWVDFDVSATASTFVSDAAPKLSAPAKIGSQVWWKTIPAVSEEQPVLVIDNTNTTPISLTVEDDIEDAVLDFTSITTVLGDTSTTTTPAQITVQSQGMTMTIPEGTVISGASNTWSGEVSLPQVVDEDDLEIEVGARQKLDVGIALSVGSDDTNLTFSNAVKLVLAGGTGMKVGFTPHNGDFTEITKNCGTDSGAAIVGNGECKYDNGTDMIVWTKHFTTFATYNITSKGSHSSGGGSSSSSVAVVTTPAAPVGQVLGAETYSFTAFLKIGAKNTEVMELQKFLNAKSLSAGPVDGIFGPMTLKAVMAFQLSAGLKADGIVGPMTRAALNK